MAPTAMRMKRPSSTSLSTLTERAPQKRARPWYVSMPSLAKLFSTRSGTGVVKPRLKAMSARQSMDVRAPSTPLPDMRQTRSTASAAPTSTFFGSQPRNTHVPPKGK